MSFTLFHIFRAKSVHSLSKYKVNVEIPSYKGFFKKCKKYYILNKVNTLYTEKDGKVYIKKKLTIRDFKHITKKHKIHTYKIFAEMKNSNNITNEAYRHRKYDSITNYTKPTADNSDTERKYI